MASVVCSTSDVEIRYWVHRSYHSCSMHSSHLDWTPTSLARPIARNGGGQTHTLPGGWRATFYASSVTFSSKCRPIECRKNALLRPMIAKSPRGTCLWTPPSSGQAPLVRWCLDHDVWKGPPSDKYDLPHSKGWLLACLLLCYQFAHAVRWVALAEKLLTQLLSSRSEKYECTHILITKLDVPASIGVHEDFLP